MLKILIVLIAFFMNLIVFQSDLMAKRKYYSKKRSRKSRNYRKTRRNKKVKKSTDKKKNDKKVKEVKKVEKKPEIIHQKIKAAITKESIDINISIKNDKNVSFVILHYASFALQDWSQEEMVKTKNGYTAEIPADFVLKKGVIYYIEAVATNGDVIASFGSEDLPVFVETYNVQRATKKVEKIKEKVKDEDYNLSLSEELSIFQMDADVETVSRRVQKSKLAPGIVSVISRAMILKTGAKKLIEVLKYLPGFSVKILPSGKYFVSIRGIGKDGNILVMINGNRINNPYDSSVIFDLSTDFIEKIEVIRGPGSSLFGTDAVVGVINIFTTKKDKSINALVGLHNDYEVSSNYSVTRKGINISLSGGVGLDDGANQNIERDDSGDMEWGLTTGDKKFETERWSRNGFLSLNLASENLKLFIFGMESKRGTWVGPNYTATKGSSYKTDTILYNLDYTIIKNKDITFSGKVYGNFFVVDNYMVTAPKGYHSTATNEDFDNGKITKENYNSMVMTAEFNLDWQVMSSLNILTGLSYQYLQILNYDLSRNYNLLTDKYHGNKFDLYEDDSSLDQNGKSRYVLEYHLQSTYNYKDFGATLGLRFDYYNDFGLTINPRAALVYNVFNLFVIKALYGQAFRAPTIKELYDKTDKSSNGILGNKDLNPENVKTSEIAIQFDLWKFNFNTNMFYNINKNIIAPFDKDGSGSVGSYQNIGETNDLGVEFALKFFLNKYFNAFFNVSWFQRKFSWNEKIWNLKAPELDSRRSLLTDIPMRTLNMGLNFNFKDFRLFLGIRNVSEALNNNRMALEEINIVNIPAYWAFDVNISYSITNNFLIYLTGVNLGNSYYASPSELGDNIAVFGDTGLIQPGYSFRLGITYRFNFEGE